jgi:hypothetical protein
VEEFSKHFLTLNREAAVAAILALTILFDVPNFVLTYRRTLLGRGSSGILVIPALAYMLVATRSQTPLLTGPVPGTLANIGARTLDLLACAALHFLLAALLPRRLANLQINRATPPEG